MKFCTVCGKELHDEAVVCMNCGCPAPNVAAPKAEPRVLITPKANESKVLPVFNFVFNLNALLANIMLWIAVAYSYISVYRSGSYYTYYNANMYLDAGSLITAFILGSGALVFGIVCFCVTLANKLKGEKLFGGITRLVVGIGMILFAMIKYNKGIF